MGSSNQLVLGLELRDCRSMVVAESTNVVRPRYSDKRALYAGVSPIVRVKDTVATCFTNCSTT